MEVSYRTATALDYAYIARLLEDGDEGLLVRSLLRSEQAPYPLLKISKGPFRVTQDGIEGYSKEGEPYSFRITDNEFCSVEIRRGSGDWCSPDFGGITLLVPS